MIGKTEQFRDKWTPDCNNCARIAEERAKLLAEIDGLLVKWLDLNKLVIKYGDTSTNWHFVAPWGFSEFIGQSIKESKI